MLTGPVRAAWYAAAAAHTVQGTAHTVQGTARTVQGAARTVQGTAHNVHRIQLMLLMHFVYITHNFTPCNMLHDPPVCCCNPCFSMSRASKRKPPPLTSESG